MALRSGARAPARLLEAAPGRPAGPARPPRRSAPSGGPDLPRRAPSPGAPGRDRGRSQGARPARRGDALHDSPRGPHGPAPPLQRPRGPDNRHSDRQPRPGRDRGAHRLLRQHPGAARRAGGRSELPRAAGAGARDHPRRLRPSGTAFREAGRGAAAGTRPPPLAALPGALRVPEPAGGDARGCGPPGTGPAGRLGRLAFRPHTLARGNPATFSRRDRVQHRPFRPLPDGADGRPSPGAARGLRLRSGPAPLRAAAPDRTGAPATPGRVERDRAGGAAGLCARADRDRGGEPAGCGGGGARRRVCELWRVGAAREPPGPPPAPAGGGTGGAGRGRGRAFAGDGGGRAGGARGRRGLPASRSLLSAGASGVDAGGLRGAGAADRVKLDGALPVLWRRGGGPGAGKLGAGGGERRRAADRRGAGEPRLRDLHLGLDGPPQGGTDLSPGAGELALVHGGAPWPGGGGGADRGDLPVVRHRGPGALPAAGPWGASGGGEPGGGGGRTPPRRAARGHGSDGDAGDARDLAPAARRGMERFRGVVGALRRRGPGGLAGGRAPRARGVPVESLWPDRDHGVVDPIGDRRWGASIDRPADRQHGCLSVRSPGSARARGSAGRAAPGRLGPGAGVSRPSRADGGAVRAAPLRGTGVAAVSDGGPGALPPGRGAGLPGPHRPAGQGARLPHRAGGDRGGARWTSVGGSGGGAGAGGEPRGTAADRVRGRPRERSRGGRVAGRPARFPAAQPAGAHGADRLGPARGAAADPERQGGPAGARRSRSRARGGSRRRPCARRGRRPRSCSPASGSGCCAGSIGLSQSTTTSSTQAGSR